MPLSESRAERLFGELTAHPLLTRRGNIDHKAFAALSPRAQLTISSGMAAFGDRSFFSVLHGAVQAAKGDAKKFSQGFKIEAPADARELPEDTKFKVRDVAGVRTVEIQVDRASEGLEAGSYSPQEVFARGYKLPVSFDSANPGSYQLEHGTVVAVSSKSEAPAAPAPKVAQRLNHALPLSENRATRLFGILNAGQPLVDAAGKIDQKAFEALPDRVQVQLSSGMAAYGDHKGFMDELQRAVVAAAGNPRSFASSLKVEPAPDARELPEGTRFLVMGESADARAVQVQIDHASSGIGAGSYSPEDLLVRGYKLPVDFEKAKEGTYLLTGGAVMAVVPYSQEVNPLPIRQPERLKLRQPVQAVKPQTVTTDTEAATPQRQPEGLEADARAKLKGVNWLYFLEKDPDERRQGSRRMVGAHKAFDAFAQHDPDGAKRLWQEVSAKVPEWLHENWAAALSPFTGSRRGNRASASVESEPVTKASVLEGQSSQLASIAGESADVAPRVRGMQA